ncbi:MAG: aminotransferase class IV [Myxococcota bacterium]
MAIGWVDLNGDIVAAEQARVSVFDRGLTRGDSVFETTRVYARVPFMLREHLERLAKSASYVGFPAIQSDDLVRRAQRLIDRGDAEQAVLRIQLTSGDAMELAPIAEEIRPTSILTLTPVPDFPVFEERGASAMISSVRRNHRLALDPLAKTGSYLNNVMAAREARRLGYDEAILLDLEGRVAEGATANLFAWIEGCWYTPPLECGILSGITRAVLLEQCREHEISAVEHPMSMEDLTVADELFLCSSVREIMPVTQLNGVQVGNGKLGPETRALYALFQAKVARYTEENGL